VPSSPGANAGLARREKRAMIYLAALIVGFFLFIMLAVFVAVIWKGTK